VCIYNIIYNTAELLKHVRKEREGHATLTEARAGSFTLATRGDAVITVTDRPAAGGKITVAVEKLAPLCATVLKEERMVDSRVLVTLRGAPEWVAGEHVVGGTDAVRFRLLKHASVQGVLKVLVMARRASPPPAAGARAHKGAAEFCALAV
jgi:hypothetical protein